MELYVTRIINSVYLTQIININMNTTDSELHISQNANQNKKIVQFQTFSRMVTTNDGTHVLSPFGRII